MTALIQLPDDVVAKGYKEVRPFHHEQVFHSPSTGFTGTDKEFLAAGHAYSYVQVDKHTRQIVEDRRPPTAIDALEDLNVEICHHSGAGHPNATPEQLAAYDSIMAERADEVRAAIEAARQSRDAGASCHYIDGIEAALQRAIDAPRTTDGPSFGM